MKKKMNLLAIIAFSITIIASIIILNAVTGYIGFLGNFIFLAPWLQLIGLLLGLISFYQIKKNGQSGLIFSIISIIIGIVFFGAWFYSSFTTLNIQ
jgi:fructose-specific phosphotransferase system IIC component